MYRITLTFVLIATALPALATTIGHWRFDEAGASNGAGIISAESLSNPGTLDAAPVGTPVYSSTVPGPLIHDPVSGNTYSNGYALDASAVNSFLRVAPDALINQPAFTAEFFLRLEGEPAAYHNFLRRLDTTYTTSSNDPTLRNRRGWQVDFDHGTTAVGGYGEPRSRFDTYDPSLVVNNVGEGQTGWNQVAHGNNIFIDTDGATNNTGDYTGGDPFDQGDGINDDSGTWHHIALTFDGTVATLYTNGASAPGNSFTLNGTFVSPDGNLEFGKLHSFAYGLFIDEVRFSDTVLDPSDFLRVVPEPASGLLLLLGGLLARLGHVTVRRGC